ncbi:hypothetical protein PMAYCL1PPCAC_23794, partial [Pristionchus mayeri]
MDSRFLLHSIVGVNVLLFVWEIYLLYRQRKHVLAFATRSEEIQSIISEEDYAKSRAYSVDRLSFIRLIAECAIVVIMLYGGYYSVLWSFSSLSSYPISLFTTLHYITSFGLDLPFSLYDNFVIEELHGFNKYTFTFYMADAIKKNVLATALTIPLGWGAVWMIENGGEFFFFYLWMFVSIVIVCMVTVYPAYIAPLFDQYSPLPEGNLKSAIEELAAKLDYPLTKIYVVDGSSRSGHSNAYMYGFWNN